jgi:glutamate--cysteine ligase
MEWALDVPMFFVIRGGTYHAGDGVTFRQFMEQGWHELRPTLGDWDTHLTTLFPDVRLKRIIEVRGADTVSRSLICALPALWKGILYDAGAREAVWEVLGGVSPSELDAGQLDVAKRGLRAEVADRKVLDLSRELVSISREGLGRIAAEVTSERNECGFLDPLFVQIEKGRSPGEEIAELWRGEWGCSRERLVEATRY